MDLVDECDELDGPSAASAEDDVARWGKIEHVSPFPRARGHLCSMLIVGHRPRDLTLVYDQHWSECHRKGARYARDNGAARRHGSPCGQGVPRFILQGGLHASERRIRCPPERRRGFSGGSAAYSLQVVQCLPHKAMERKCGPPATTLCVDEGAVGVSAVGVVADAFWYSWDTSSYSTHGGRCKLSKTAQRVTSSSRKPLAQNSTPCMNSKNAIRCVNRRRQ